jgi:hypothetical protein
MELDGWLVFLYVNKCRSYLDVCSVDQSINRFYLFSFLATEVLAHFLDKVKVIAPSCVLHIPI